MVELAMLALLLPSGVQTTAFAPPGDIALIAETLVGEGCHLVPNRNLAGVAMTQAILNHPLADLGVEGVVKTYYHGYKPLDTIPLWALRAAEMGYLLHQAHIDVTEGSYFVLSRTDLQQNNAWFMRDRASLVLDDGKWGLYWFTFWPL